VETIKDRKEKYGRYLAVVYYKADSSIYEGLPNIRKIGDLFCLNDILISKGLAQEYMI
jgi:micrococcal nuclease